MTEITEKQESEPIETTDSLPLDLQFELLLHKKTMEKTANQRSSMRKYYKDQYQKTGLIPRGLFLGRRGSGRKQSYSEDLEKRFIEIVKNSATSKINSPEFITKNLRTIVNFHRRLKEEFGEIELYTLYRLANKHKLKKYLQKPDYSEQETSDILTCFEALEVFDLIQVDGSEFKYLEIKDDLGQFKRPLVIEFMDVGSRYMLAMDIYFSESNLNSINAFEKFLNATPFPKKEIRFRPDNSKGFVNLKRPLRELNLKYSLPEQFYFSKDFAKVRRPKNKAHLESSHRRLHGFEDFIINKLPFDKLLERVPGVKIKTKSGKVELVTISRFNITLEELRASSLINLYLNEHNETLRAFSQAGKIVKWQPKQKFEDYLAQVKTFRFKEADIENCLKYGFAKEIATVSPEGHIRFKNQDYQVVVGDCYGGSQRSKIKVSLFKDKLYLFNKEDEGVLIGEAVLICAPKTINTIKAREVKLEKNDFEHLVVFLEQQGMKIINSLFIKLLDLYKQGLTLKTAVKIIEQNKQTYDNYRLNPELKQAHVGHILANLFFAHYAAYKKLNQNLKL